MALDTEKSVADSAPAAKVPTSHPIGFWFFFWGEFAERASYYGMRTILTLYLTAAIGLATTEASPIQYYFKASVYFLPLLGGFIADRFFGKYWTIVGFSIPYVAGHFILGIPDRTAVYIALALLAGGSGVIKPNISTLMGRTYDEQRPGQEKLLSSAFLWFYFSINIGSLISTFALPAIRNFYAGPIPDPTLLGQAYALANQFPAIDPVKLVEVVTRPRIQHAYALAFQFPAWLMVIALAVFAAGKPFYAKDKIVRRQTSPEERAERWRTLLKLAGIFAMIIFFWIPYEHNDTIWVIFIRDYVRLPSVPHGAFFGFPKQDFQIAPDQVQSLNPLFVLIFAPFFVWFFRKTDPNGRIFTATNRMLLGFLMAAISSGLMFAASTFATGSPGTPQGYIVPEVQKLSVLWPAAAYITLTLAEVLIYGTGLELSYTAAPQSMKGFITGCFLATIGIADLIDSRIGKLYGGSLPDPLDKRGPFSPAWFFGSMMAIAIAAIIGFYFVGRRLERRSAASASPARE
jgi:POT family proton-dependent oligopeptide transporter